MPQNRRCCLVWAVALTYLGGRRAGGPCDASPRVRASSFRRIAETWWSTVRRETTRRSAISALRSPSDTSASTSSSRAVNCAAFSRVEARGPRGTSRTPCRRSRCATTVASGRAPSSWQISRARLRLPRPRSARARPRSRRDTRDAPTRLRPPPTRRPPRVRRGRSSLAASSGSKPASVGQYVSRATSSRAARRLAASSSAAVTRADLVRAPLEPCNLGVRGCEFDQSACLLGETPTSLARRESITSAGSPRRARTSASTRQASSCGHGDSRGSRSSSVADSAASVQRP